jgi:murein L,D-transpeptidase YcbB/YkuD
MIARFLLALVLALLPWPAMAMPKESAGLGSELSKSADNVRQFYLRHGEYLAWSGGAQEKEDAATALGILVNAAKDGLDPERYRINRGGTDAAADDIALSAALLEYMRDLAVGRQDLAALDADVALPKQVLDSAQVLDEALRQHRLAAALAALAPPYNEYIVLKAELARNPGGPDSLVIIANMERWRWMPRVLESDRIVVNAADASLQLWLGGKVVLTSRVIVGRPVRPTPILRAEGAGVTFNPSWTVPHSIAAKEILPKLKRDQAYLASQDMILLNGPPGDPHGLSVNWRAIPKGRFPFQIRQVPGPRNALGQIKLELPNRFDVYLHDTPGKTAFSRPRRALSHGCVRVEQILPLASYALKADLSDEERIRQVIGTGATSYAPLEKKLPVYFLYWTAFQDTQGKLQFRPDIYGRDRRLIAAMHARTQRIAGSYLPCPKG